MARPANRGARRVVAACAVLVGLGASLAGCSTGAYQYESNKQFGVYFKVPTAWKPFNRLTLFNVFDVNSTDGSVSEQGASEVFASQWQLAFDGSGKAKVADLDPTADTPVVRVLVRPILTDEQQTFSLNDLRAADLFDPTTLGEAIQSESTTPITSYSQIIQPSELQTLTDQPLKQKGFIGVHYVANLRENSGGQLVTFDITGWADTALSTEYFMIVSCSNLCYTDNESTISKITSSFTVRGTS
jgi:hypothetical protein